MHARGKTIGYAVVSMKIAWSRLLGIWATRKHNESVDICEKIVSIFFNSSNEAHECHKINDVFWLAHRSHAHRPYPLQAMCFVLMRTTGLVEIVNKLRCKGCAGHVLHRALVNYVLHWQHCIMGCRHHFQSWGGRLKLNDNCKQSVQKFL